MKRFNDISEQELGAKFRLSEAERSEIWSRIETGLDRGSGRGGFVRWSIASVAAAAAIVLGLFLTMSDPARNSIESNAEVNGGTGGFIAVNLTENPPSAAATDDDLNATATEKSYPVEGESAQKRSDAATADAAPANVVPADAAPADVVPAKDNTAKDNTAEDSIAEAAKKDNTYSGENGRTGKKQDGQKTGRAKNRTGKKEYFADEFYSTGKSRFALSASSDMTRRGDLGTSTNSYIKSVASKVHFVAPGELPLIEPISEKTNYLPLNFAVQGSYRISDRLTIGAGISYSYLHSKFDGLINKQAYSIKQDIHYVGIPVNLFISMAERGNFDFYANIGGSVEKGIRLRYEMKTYDRKKSYNSHIKGFQYSLNGGLGVEYRFGSSKRTGIFIEPNAVYYFDSKAPGCIRTEQPLQIEAEIGIRIHLK